MMIANYNKINEDFLDDVHVEDEVRVDVTADEELTFEYLLRIDFKNKEVADKLYLHAYKIDLTAVYGQKKIIKAGLPQHFTDACQFFGLEIEK
jgi:hypothetical protein